MGLEFTNSSAYWSYSGFHSFRTRLAKEIGIDLNSMEGFDGNGKWEDVKDPIAPFLYHEDCEGRLYMKEMKAIVPRLKELVKFWEDGHDKKMCMQLVKDMTKLIKTKKPLEFC